MVSKIFNIHPYLGKDFHFGSYFWNGWFKIVRTFVTRAFRTFLMMPMRHARFHHPTASKQVNLRRVGPCYSWIAKIFALKWRFGFNSIACFDSEIAVEANLCDLFVIWCNWYLSDTILSSLSLFLNQWIFRKVLPFSWFLDENLRGERRFLRVRHRENVGSDWLRVGLRIHNARAADGSLGLRCGLRQDMDLWCVYDILALMKDLWLMILYLLWNLIDLVSDFPARYDTPSIQWHAAVSLSSCCWEKTNRCNLL